jgi:hypothetical protein
MSWKGFRLTRPSNTTQVVPALLRLSALRVHYFTIGAGSGQGLDLPAELKKLFQSVSRPIA